MSHLRHLSLVLLALVPTARGSAEVPDRAWSERIQQEAPMWISEDLAVEGHQLQKQHFRPDLLPLVEQKIESSRPRNSRGCELYTETAPPRAPADGRTPHPRNLFKGTTAEAIRANSAQVVLGTVTDLKQGFLSGQPGTMVEISLDPGKQQLGAQRVYVFLSVAAILVDGIHLCTGLSDGRAIPSAGASIVLALDAVLDEERILGRTDESEPIIWPQPNEVLISGALPKSYESLEVDVDALRDQLRKEGGRG